MDEQEKQRRSLQKAVIETVENISLLEGGSGCDHGFDDDLNMQQASLTMYLPYRISFELTVSATLLEEIVATLYGVEREEITQSLENEVLADILNSVAEKIVPELDDEAEIIKECATICSFQQDNKLLRMKWSRFAMGPENSEIMPQELSGGLTID